MTIRYSKQAIKVIAGMDKTTKQRIHAAIERLPEGDVKLLHGRISTHRLRVGGWRILFSFIDTDIIFIEKIAPRGEVYKGV